MDKLKNGLTNVIFPSKKLIIKAKGIRLDISDSVENTLLFTDKNEKMQDESKDDNALQKSVNIEKHDGKVMMETYFKDDALVIELAGKDDAQVKLSLPRCVKYNLVVKAKKCVFTMHTIWNIDIDRAVVCLKDCCGPEYTCNGRPTFTGCCPAKDMVIKLHKCAPVQWKMGDMDNRILNITQKP